MTKKSRSPVVIKEFGKIGYVEIWLNNGLYGTIRHPNYERCLRIAEGIKRDLERLFLSKSNDSSE